MKILRKRLLNEDGRRDARLRDGGQRRLRGEGASAGGGGRLAPGLSSGSLPFGRKFWHPKTENETSRTAETSTVTTETSAGTAVSRTEGRS